MVDALISVVLDQLASIFDREMQLEVRLVVGVEKEVQKLTSSLKAIQSVLDDAEKRKVKEATVKDWLEKLKDISYDIDDVLDEWSSAILKSQIGVAENAPFPKNKVCSFIPSACICFSNIGRRRDIALKIKKLKERLDVVAIEKDRYNFNLMRGTEESKRLKTTSFLDVSEVRGRDDDKETIVNKLCESSQEIKGLHIVSIVGMGGIGKTTLAQLAYNNDKVKSHFEKRMWVCVSDPFEEIRIAKAILETLTGAAPNLVEFETLLQQISQSVEGKKFLLVLDDVWSEEYEKWEPLKNSLEHGAPGSIILVTTRKERVAKILKTAFLFPLGKLSEKECWSLFSQLAFFERGGEESEGFKDIGRQIADKCKGLPLAARVLGNLMRFKKTREEWQNVLDSEVWELEEAERGLFPPLLLSYYDLPPAMRRCFSYCAIFPKDYKIEKDKLIKLWMAQGYLNSKGSTEMEVTGKEYLENLVARSFFQEDYDGSRERCKMHNIVHDFAQFLTKTECCITKVDGGEESCRISRHSTLKLAAGAQFPTSNYNAKNSRTLLVLSDYSSEFITGLPDVLRRSTHLRALDLSNCSIIEVPMEVGKLIHLRYLDLSNNEKLKELPATVCDLCNLQTLNLNQCVGLQSLPQGLGNLINLTHFEFNGVTLLRSLPKGLGRLSSLRTLSKFIVSGDDNGDACKIADLKSLNCLRGSLDITGLGYVSDVGEAEKAELKSKRHILHLDLDFSGKKARGGMDDCVIEALQPPPNIEKLKICFYNGTILFPSWLMALSKLRMLQLHGCRNLKCLPPLGKLPILESLEISYVNSVKKVGAEFLGAVIDHNSIAEEPEGVIAFPKLRQLRLSSMNEWEEWDGITKRREAASTIMPCLRYLSVADCPKLKALPDYLLKTPVEELIFCRCPVINLRYRNVRVEDWTRMSHIPHIEITDS